MNDHTIFIGRKTRVDASVLIFGVVDIKAFFSHFTPSVRERGSWRSGPFILTSGVGFPRRSQGNLVSLPRKPVTCPGGDSGNLGAPLGRNKKIRCQYYNQKTTDDE